MYLAFKVKAETLVERLIAFFTGSSKVHCELVTSLYKDQFFGYTSMPFEGVTKHWVRYEPDAWEFLKIPDTECVNVLDFYEKTKNRRYDYLGCLGFVFGNPDDPSRYFCSEWCAECLGLENPSKYTPNDLYEKFHFVVKS